MLFLNSNFRETHSITSSRTKILWFFISFPPSTKIFLEENDYSINISSAERQGSTSVNFIAIFSAFCLIVMQNPFSSDFPCPPKLKSNIRLFLLSCPHLTLLILFGFSLACETSDKLQDARGSQFLLKMLLLLQSLPLWWVFPGERCFGQLEGSTLGHANV